MGASGRNRSSGSQQIERVSCIVMSEDACGFCEGSLSEMAQQLNATRRLPDGRFEVLERSHDSKHIMWCGNCPEGLTHKFHRYSSEFLEARLAAYRVWAAGIEGLDGGDPAEQLERLLVVEEIPLMEQELEQRSH